MERPKAIELISPLIVFRFTKQMLCKSFIHLRRVLFISSQKSHRNRDADVIQLLAKCYTGFYAIGEGKIESPPASAVVKSFSFNLLGSLCA